MIGLKWKRILLWLGACIIFVLVVIFSIRAYSAEEETVTVEAYIVGCAYEQEEWVSDEEEREEEPLPSPSDSDARLIAQILYYEIGAGTKLEISAVVWTILNRVDSEIPYFPDTIEEVCKQSIKSNGKEVFMFAYKPDAPVREDLYDMAMDVMTRWYREKRGERDVGRTLPVEYVYFWGNGKTNFFRIEYQGKNYWDWSLPDPYQESEEP